MWAQTGANVTQGGTTTSLGVASAATVEVTEGTDETTATVVRFFNVCRVGGVVQTFPAAAVADVRATNVSYACKPSFGTPPAGPGSLDSSFGSDGQVRTELPGFSGQGLVLSSDVAAQPDGKVVVAGRVSRDGLDVDALALTRYNPDGSLDASFGSSGRVVTDVVPALPGDLDEGIDDPAALLLQPDGKIVVAGRSYRHFSLDFLVVRYNPDGSLDTGFGTGGKVVTDFGPDHYPSDAALQPDGKILLVGIGLKANGAASDAAVVRYNANGSLDSSFGEGGRALVDRLQYDSSPNVVVQASGKIVLEVESFTPTGVDRERALVRLNPNGSLDTSFGTAGVVSTQDPVADLLLQPDGKLITVGSDRGVPVRQVFLARYNQNGTPDSSFGAGGRAVSFLDLDVEEAALQADGKIVTAGSGVGPDLSRDFAVARFNANGWPDASFGALGRATADFDGEDDRALDVALQPDGRIVTVGTSGYTYTAFKLARFLP